MPKFEIFKDVSGEYRYRAVASNGEILCVSEGYRDARDARRGTRALRVAALTARVVEVAE